jgi:hypothetical protein
VYLYEAIEKAGEGGRVRRKGQSSSALIPEMNHENFELSHGLNADIYVLGINDLTATDWEVVSEEIKVGDEVRCKWDLKEDMNAIVIGIDLTCGTQNIYIQWNDSSIDIRNLSDLTLIRKGKVHTFEGMTFKELELAYPDPTNGVMASVPHSFQPMRDLKHLCDNGKFYKMTLEEES